MIYRDSTDHISTATKIIKVNHAGEFGAISIYKAQIWIATLVHPSVVPTLKSFLEDEKRHLSIFWDEINRRNGIKCKSYWLCGLGGIFLGLISALLGKRSIAACTWAVESVVVDHLKNQLTYLKVSGEVDAFNCVESILADEQNHRDHGNSHTGNNFFYQMFKFLIKTFTKGVIQIGMR